MVKMFEQTVENEMEGSLGEYETAAERNSRDRRADADRDVICDVTSLKLRFWGPRMEKKMHSCLELLLGAQAVDTRPYV